MNRRWLLCVIALAAILMACAGMAVVVERPIADRIRGRTFPSVFQAWGGVGHGAYEEAAAALPRHDLIFQGPEFFGLFWKGDFPGLATGFTPASRLLAAARRKQLLMGNPRMILLAEVRYRDAPSSWLPENHAWWKHENGRRAAGWEEGKFYKLDFANPDYRRHVARQAAALMETGAVDGIMLDWWTDDDDHVALVTEIRTAIGDDPLILVNANDRRIPRTAPLVNGLFMECPKSTTPEDWARIADTLAWAEGAVRPPRINCLETWWWTLLLEGK